MTGSSKLLTERAEKKEEGETVDAVFEGRLMVVQGKDGYRFSLDSVLLAHFARLPAGGKVIDLGSGNGPVALMLAFLHPSAGIVGLELQRAMVERARKGAELNGLEKRVEWVHGDVRAIERHFRPRSFDAAVSNPPYRREASGRVNPDPEKRVARHEAQGKLRDFLRAGATLLRHGRTMAVVYPATRMIDLLETMRQEGVEPKRLQLVQSVRGAEATLVLAEGSKAGRPGVKVLPPLVIYGPEGGYTSELRSILAGNEATRPL